jgi:hypothetical protein
MDGSMAVELWRAVVRPIIEYAAVVWAPMCSTSAIERLEVLQRQCLKKIVGMGEMHNKRSGARRM